MREECVIERVCGGRSERERRSVRDEKREGKKCKRMRERNMKGEKKRSKE